MSVGAPPFGGVAAAKELAARIRRHPRDTAGQHVGQRGEVGHSGRLAAVERSLDGLAPSAGFEVDEVGHVASSDTQAERVAAGRRAFEELREVHTDATVVNSLTVTFFGGVVPSTVSNPMASFAPLSAAALGVPPLATT